MLPVCTGIQLIPQLTAQQEQQYPNVTWPISLHGTSWYSDVVFMETYFPPNPWSRPVFEFPRIVVALQDTSVYYLTIAGWKQIRDISETSDTSITAMAVSFPEDCRPPEVVIAIASNYLPWAGVYYYSGGGTNADPATSWENLLPEYQDEYEWPQPVIMAVQFSPTGGNPQVVAGGKGGEVAYYDGHTWTPILGAGWIPTAQLPFTQLTAQFPSAAWDRLQVVVGLNAGTVWYCDGEACAELTTPQTGVQVGWDTAFSALHARFSLAGAQPEVLLGTENGNVQYYNGSQWTALGAYWPQSVSQLEVQWSATPGAAPQCVVALSTAEVLYYTGSDTAGQEGWVELHDAGWNTSPGAMAVQFQGPKQPQVVMALGNGAVFFYVGHGETRGWKELAQVGTQLVAGMAARFPDTPGDAGDGNQYFYPEVVIGLGGYSSA